MPSNNDSTKASNAGDDWVRPNVSLFLAIQESFSDLIIHTSEPAPTFLLENTGDRGASEDFITQQMWHLILSKMERDFFFSRPETYNSHEELINPMPAKDVKDWLSQVVEPDELSSGWDENSFDDVDANEHERLGVDNEQRFKFKYREFYDEELLDCEY